MSKSNYDTFNDLVKYDCKLLRKRLFMHFNHMKKIYKLACNKTQKASFEEWFTDNFYIIEKETKNIIKILKHKYTIFASKHDDTPIIYKIPFNFFINTSEPKVISEKSIIEMITNINDKIYLSVDELAFLPTTIRIVLIDSVYFAIRNNLNEEEISKTIAYAIKGIIDLESIDFNNIIEHVSPIEKIFLKDPTNVYANMDDATKSYYRYLLSIIAKKKKTNEKNLAEELLLRAQNENIHIGKYLINDDAITIPKNNLAKLFININIFVPLFISIILSIIFKNIFAGIIAYFPLWEIIRPINQYFIFKNTREDFLPRIDINNSVPIEGKTLVVVSTILPSANQAKNLKTRLENLYFSNGSGHVNFCILADFTQNKYPEAANDKSQIDASARVIKYLNNKYGNRFCLIVRNRTFNNTQKAYIGWERKRGAITELIRFIKGHNSSIATFEGNKRNIINTKYIVVLDSDTELLIDSTQKFVATALHPLNKPVIDPVKNIVVDGHAIFTPRIGINLASAKNTLFSRVMAGCGGTTMYDISSKDLYQDLFGESIFSGKGLIDVDAFYQVLNDKFPENVILSHDILEGIYLRAGFVADVEVVDGYPSNISSWLSRLHRWIRGDWQNSDYLFNNDLSSISKYKIFDNLRRSINPILSLLCIIVGMLSATHNLQYGVTLSLIGFLSVTFGSLFASAISILSSGWFTLSRKFYTQVVPEAFEYMFQAIFSIIMLVKQSLVALDAIIRSLYRKFISKKNLLEWVTAEQAENQKMNLISLVKKFFLSECIGILILLFSPFRGFRIFGILFSFIFPLAIISDSKSYGKTTFPSKYKETLIGFTADMWKFYEDHFNKKCNYLPPDNIQLSPIRAIAYRTSPTNIGFLLISTLAARDFDFIDTETLYTKINKTITTIEKLKKWHGNLYNWYDIKTLETIDTFISTVDSGNFVACLVAVKEGLKDYYFEKKELSDLVKRLQKLIDDTELTPFYSKKRNLFTIGYDVATKKFTNSHYDFLMSEARLTSYFAIAKRQVPKKHWGYLSRTLSRNGLYAGPISWTGTMFEFFMPHLLLPSYSGSLLDEALRYCVYCQRKRTADSNIPWGISESAFYAFDNNLYYQYKAHGVQKLGIKQNLDKELVISPYSTFLTLSYAPKMAMRNLFQMEKMGFKGIYGFFEAIDFTKSRVEDMEIIKSYMAHHIGMSIIAAANAIFDNRIQKRYMRDKNMKSTKELIEEKIPRDSVIFDNTVKTVPQKNTKGQKSIQGYTNFSPDNPKFIIFKNADITSIFADTGSSHLTMNDKCLTRKSIDMIRKPQGIFLFVHSDNLSFSATPAPFYDKDVNYQTRFSSHNVSYFSKKSFLQTGIVCYIDKTLPCEQRKIAFKNNALSKKTVDAMILLEPILTPFDEYISHPAFTKLFVTSYYDKGSNILIFNKRLRENETPIYLAIGFLQNVPFQFETKKESLIKSNDIEKSILSFWERDFKPSNGLPDCIAAIKFSLDIPAGTQKDLTLIITASESYSGVIKNIIESRNKDPLNSKNSAQSKILGDTIEDKISFELLPIILCNRNLTSESLASMKKNQLRIDGLWSMSISGDLPIVLLEVNSIGDEERIEIYVKTLKKLRLCGILFDLVLTYRELNGETILKNMIDNIIKKLDVSILVKTKGGIFLVNVTEIDPEKIVLLRALSQFIVPHNLSKDTIDVNQYVPIKINHSYAIKKDLLKGYSINGGTFLNDRFYVNKTSNLPYTHVLSNQTFGTLLSSNHLGFSWASNSRESKLTPWYNDIATDNDGEMLILRYKNNYYNLLSGSLASFSPLDAKYEGYIDDLKYTITVWVPQVGNYKYTSVEILNSSSSDAKIQLAYYTEPILGINHLDANKVYGDFIDDTIILKNCLNNYCMALTATNHHSNLYGLTNKFNFFSGNWCQKSDSTSGNVCGTLISDMNIPANESSYIKFSLSFSKNGKVLYPLDNKKVTTPLLPSKNTITVSTPDESLNYMINTWIPHQIISGRIRARAGFYQCGGAYGFRDQLQDSLCYILLDPNVTKQQILRACAVQFEDGDVLHWWHNIPNSEGGLRGVRTKYSDDLLWLPFVTAEYVLKTGDTDILDISISYIEGERLRENEHEKYFIPQKSNLKENVYHHCLKSIERSLKFGKNGIPHIGCGDWSDGYNKVGINGKGESVWLGMFLSMILDKFSIICNIKGDNDRSNKFKDISLQLKKNIDKNCWDGNWYLRAFYDDGSKMGSHECQECMIDSLPQSFSVLCNMPDKERVSLSLQSSIKHLVDKNNMLINLFSPPFANSEKNPGYVKSYPAGIRENGGQYTHAGLWLAMALINFGEVDTGYQLLQILNPAYRCQNKTIADKYKIEPYYMAGDIYSNRYIAGHGGWSIYTGSSGWYYKVVTENLLGINMQDGRIEINPKMPSSWDSFSAQVDINNTKINLSVSKKTSNDQSTSLPYIIPCNQKIHNIEILL